jgi:hypothetical protein
MNTCDSCSRKVNLQFMADVQWRCGRAVGLRSRAWEHDEQTTRVASANSQTSCRNDVLSAA